MTERSQRRVVHTAIQSIGGKPILWAVLPLFGLDIICIVLSMLLAYQVRFEWMDYFGPRSSGFYLDLAWVVVLTWPAVFAIHRLYHPDHLFGGLQEYASVVSATTSGIVVLILYSFVNRGIEYDISRGWLAILWCFVIGSVTVARFGYRRLVYLLRQRGRFTSRALVVGANEEGQLVATQLRAAPTAGVEVVGFIDPSLPPGTEIDGVPVLGGLDALDRQVERLGVDEVIIIPTALRRRKLLDFYRDWGTDDRVRVSLSSGLYELFTTGVQVREVGYVPLLHLNRLRITGLDALMKSALDYGGALVGMVLLSPLFLLVALLVRIDSPGPVIYRRRVVGLYGRTFDAYKFRTMIVDADAYLEARPELKAEWDQYGKIEDDPRITRVGRTLRQYSLDEFPQLFNVLKGEMSLVGPRMITPAELDHFGRWRHNLLTVKPGMTGLWQISGRADLSYEERVRLDMQYIRNYTIWLDLKVLLNTAWAVLVRRGAY
ncbi:MAG: sugar transferase [Anaerolineae bacterium]|jgi:exopolysaccharide biosynthesis polyprenyl glycosylphosphotransferase